ncbi:MAG: alpha/beta fold hydrolase [Clostridia bacterium]|nr:alpha/beta fold hydrolase [Clostridia bacterium]
MKRPFQTMILLLALMLFGLFGCSGENTEVKDYEVREFTLQREEMNIYGELYVPNDLEGKAPVVILSHSSGLNADSMQPYCHGFANRGYVAYAFDFCGGSKHSRSDGAETDMTVFTETDDLKAVFEAISKLDFVDPERIYLFGTSQGGLVSALVANDLADRVKGLILLYPAFNIPELVRMSEKFGDFQFGSTQTGEAFRETLKEFDPYEHIGNFQGEVLIVHGTMDFIVKSSYSQRAAEVYARCTLELISGASHGFNAKNYSLFGDYDEQVWKAIDAYLNESS